MFEGLFQPTHLIVVLAIALLIIGPKKLPELGAGLGKSIREFKKGMSNLNRTALDGAPEGTKEQAKTGTVDAKQDEKG